MEDLNTKFKKDQVVLGTIFGSGSKDLIIYDEKMNNRTWVDFPQVKELEVSND